MSGAERKLRGIVGLLSRLDERRFPRATSVSIGVISAGLGLLFLFLPGRLATAATAVLLGVAPAVVWGSILLALGASLATAAIVAYERSHALSGLLSIILFGFSLLCGLGVFAGASSGIVPLLTLGFAWLLLLSAITGLAPRLKALLT